MTELKKEVKELLDYLEKDIKKRQNELTVSLSNCKDTEESRSIMQTIGKRGKTLGLIEYVRNNLSEGD